jgi:hypothetical protein
MTLRRIARKIKPRTIWEQKGAPPAAKDPKIPRKAARTVKKSALKPVITGPLPEYTGLDKDHLPELPDYILSFDLC